MFKVPQTNQSSQKSPERRERESSLIYLLFMTKLGWVVACMVVVGCSRDHRDYEDQVPRHNHLGRKEKGYGSLEARRKESFLFRVQREWRGTSSWEEVAWLKLNESIISKAKKDERIILSRADRLGTDKDNKDHLHKLKAAWFGSSTG